MDGWWPATGPAVVHQEFILASPTMFASIPESRHHGGWAVSWSFRGDCRGCDEGTSPEEMATRHEGGAEARRPDLWCRWFPWISASAAGACWPGAWPSGSARPSARRG